MDVMAPKKKKASERRESHLGIRLTAAEMKALRARAEGLSMDQSTLARIALVVGLNTIKKRGIPAQLELDDG